VNHVVSFYVRVIPLKDFIAPPVTSKLFKSCLSLCSEGRKLVGGFSPSFLSMLFFDGRPLYSVPNRPPIVLRGGSTYLGRVSLVVEDLSFADVLNSQAEVKCSNAYGDYVVLIDEVEVLDFSALRLDLSRVFKITFLTPTILTAKHMMPPPLRDKSKSLPEMNKLIPQPSHIFSYLLKLWNALAPPNHRIPNESPNIWTAYKLGRLADVTLVEINYNIRPETVIIGRNTNGKLREARGFKGWVIYKSIAPKKLHETYAKLLALGEKLGIGRSRGIGLGQIKTENIEENPGKTRETQQNI